MQDNLSYEKFLDWAVNFNFPNDRENFKFEYILRKVSEYITIPDEGIFYPQNIFEDDKETDLLFFTNTRIYRITGSENNVLFEVFYLKDVIDYNFELSKEDERESVTLKIFFTLNRTITLNNLSDTNTHWSSTFGYKIKEIFKLFLII